jgi:ABC-2 type transport system permease protein
VALVVVLLTFASLGLGLLISTVVDSERAAVQLSMLVLLASVFFSGFVLPLDQFITPVRILAYALPVTHGIQLLQDFMLRGSTNQAWELYALGAIGVVLFLITSVTVRRNLRSSS